jgi:beta-galactosidase
MQSKTVYAEGKKDKTMKPLPQFPYGAVYFRKSNPPKEDWSRDYRVAAQDGANMFRHWFMWSAIEIAPGIYDWEDYDRQLDLAAESGITTIIAEHTMAAPEWVYRKYSHARYEGRDGKKAISHYSGSCVTGGFHGICLDNDDVRGLAGRFLKELALHYKGHPGLGGYDIWNECNFPADYCYCPATAEKFRAWLRRKYGNLRNLAQTWQRHSLAEWVDVEPPRDIGPYPDFFDWLEFRIDNAYVLMQWRADILRAADPDHSVNAHGVAQTLWQHADSGCDEWRAARVADNYGFTWIAARRGNEPWKQYHAADITRAGARGKPFWHAEAQNGPLWMQPQVIGRPRDDGRIADPDDIRLWHFVSMAGGQARG